MLYVEHLRIMYKEDKMLKILNFKTVGYLILAYAGVSFALANTGVIQGVDGTWYNKLIMTILTGVASIYLNGQGFTLQGVLAKILAYFKVGPIVETIDTSILDDINDIAEALKLAGDDVGVGLCKQLNVHVFDSIYSTKIKVEASSVEKV